MRSSQLMKAALAGAMTLALAGQAVAQERVKIRVAWIVPVTNIGSILFAKDGIARHRGKSYDAEFSRFEGSTPQITGLATGNLDIALLGFTSLPLAVLNADMQDIRVIADEIRDGVPGYHSNEFFVLADGPIKSVADLKGQVLATNAFGSAVDVAVRAMLKKAGIDPKTGVTTVEAPFPSMKAMLLEKKAVLIPSVPPFSRDPELRGQSRALFVQSDGVGVGALAVFAARQSYIDKNRAALVDFLEDYLRMVRWYTDPANSKEAAGIASSLTKAPPERFSWLFTKEDYYRDPNGLVDVKSLQTSVDLQRDLGLIKSTIDVSKYVDMSLVQEAAKRIK
jgi:sulfonate transport system substrate-binding protein